MVFMDKMHCHSQPAFVYMGGHFYNIISMIFPPKNISAEMPFFPISNEMVVIKEFEMMHLATCGYYFLNI